MYLTVQTFKPTDDCVYHWALSISFEKKTDFFIKVFDPFCPKVGTLIRMQQL